VNGHIWFLGVLNGTSISQLLTYPNQKARNPAAFLLMKQLSSSHINVCIVSRSIIRT
jgi:hypothetical protein